MWCLCLRICNRPCFFLIASPTRPQMVPNFPPLYVLLLRTHSRHRPSRSAAPHHWRCVAGHASRPAIGTAESCHSQPERSSKRTACTLCWRLTKMAIFAGPVVVVDQSRHRAGHVRDLHPARTERVHCSRVTRCGLFSFALFCNSPVRSLQWTTRCSTPPCRTSCSECGAQGSPRGADNHHQE